MAKQSKKKLVTEKPIEENVLKMEGLTGFTEQTIREIMHQKSLTHEAAIAFIKANINK